MSKKDSGGEINTRDPSTENVPTVARLCYVDDSRTSAYVVRKLLEPLGYQVNHFASAEPAFVALVQEDYDLLLTDLKVSSTGMDGDDLIRTLRQSGHPKISTMPIIVITGASDAEVLVGVYDVGANQVMKKPVDGDELDGHIRRLLFDHRRIETPSAAVETSLRRQNQRSSDATVVTLHTAQRPVPLAEPPVISTSEPPPPAPELAVPVLSAVEQPDPAAAEPPLDTETPISPTSEPSQVSAPAEVETLNDSSIVRAMNEASAQMPSADTKTADVEVVEPERIVEPDQIELRAEVLAEDEVVIIERGQPKQVAAQPSVDHDLLREIEQYPLVATQRRGLFAGSGVVDMLRSLVERVGLRRLFMRTVAVLAALFVTLMVANFYFYQGVPVDTVPVASGEIFQSITVPGRVVSQQRVDVSPARAGRLVKVEVKEGDRVQQGQVLARIDDRELLSRLKRAQASLSAVRQDISQAQRALDRLRKAHAKGAVARRLVEDAEVDLRSARRKAGIVVEEVSSATLDVDKQKIVAAFDGTITARYAEIGQWVGPTEALFTLVDESQREIEVYVDAADSGAIDVGQVVAVSSDIFPGLQWQESVVRMAAEAGSSSYTHSVKVYISLGMDAPALRYGQQVDADIRTAWNPNTLKIPFAALISRDGQTMVAVLEDGKARMKIVETGIEDFAMVEIKQGLNAGERVILSKGMALQNGDRVQPRRAGE